MAEHPDSPDPQPPPDTLVPTPLIRRNNQSPEDRPALPPDIEAQFQQLAQAVQILSGHFLGYTGTEPTPENSKERGARRIRKFQRASGDERLPTAGSVDETTGEVSFENAAGGVPGDAPDETDSLARNKHIAWPRQHSSDGAAGAESALALSWLRQPRTRRLLGLVAGGVAVAGRRASGRARHGIPSRRQSRGIRADLEQSIRTGGLE